MDPMDKLAVIPKIGHVKIQDFVEKDERKEGGAYLSTRASLAWEGRRGRAALRWESGRASPSPARRSSRP